MATKLDEMRPDGCFARAMDDEPMFVLLARDPSAPQLILAWAEHRETEINAGRRPTTDRAQVDHARQCAQQMEQWREDNDGAWREGLFGRG